MKPVKNFIFALLLVSAMSVSAIAGVQDTPGNKEEPPPAPPQMTIYDGTTSGSNTDQADGITTETSDYLFLDALVALLSVY